MYGKIRYRGVGTGSSVIARGWIINNNGYGHFFPWVLSYETHAIENPHLQVLTLNGFSWGSFTFIEAESYNVTIR